ncbi:hypothetical protein ACRQ1B_05080 [Rhizobium panacihumi]|uniref:hypothetical protein n=1 Tax=Rhizobium panacihumi TaxID=2008450 RepID=UPI003D7B338E
MSGAGYDEDEARRRVLVVNERRKLLAGALDRVSTAFIVVGVLGQALSLNPASASFAAAIVMLGWISGAVILHLVAQRVLGGLKV